MQLSLIGHLALSQIYKTCTPLQHELSKSLEALRWEVPRRWIYNIDDTSIAVCCSFVCICCCTAQTQTAAACCAHPLRDNVPRHAVAMVHVHAACAPAAHTHSHIPTLKTHSLPNPGAGHHINNCPDVVQSNLMGYVCSAGDMHVFTNAKQNETRTSIPKTPTPAV